MASPHDLAQAAYEALRHGDADAPARFAEAIAADPSNSSLILAEAEALMIAGADDPAARLRATVQRHPDWAEGQAALAALLWELGSATDYRALFEDALRSNPANAGLWNAYFRTLEGVGDHASAAGAAAQAGRYFNDPVLTLIEAINRGMIGEHETVERLIASVPPSPERDQVEVRHRIRLADWDAALRIVDRMLHAPAPEVGSWAIAEVLWRKTSDPRWAWLAGDARFTMKSTLSYSPEELELLAGTLESLHRQQRQPVGQSVRGGTQTRGRLLDRRDDRLAALRVALQSAVDDYRRQLPPADSRHPLLKHRDRDMKIDGGWSVRLTSAGFHVPHLHHAGVLSSAFYVRVPDLDVSSREGWLELGRPPPDLELDLEPLASVEPQPGSLVLFPSYLYHGTRPFFAGERMSVAFDVT